MIAIVDPSVIKDVTDPVVIERAVLANSSCLFHTEQTEELCWKALKSDVESICYIKKPTEEMSEYAIKEGHTLRHIPIECRSQYLCHLALKNDLAEIEYWPEEFITDEICESIVMDYCLVVKHMKNPPEDMIIDIINKHPTAIINIPNLPDEIVNQVLSRQGMIIMFLIDKTEERCMIAINQNWKVLQFIGNQTLEMCKAAIAINPLAINYVNHEFLVECLQDIRELGDDIDVFDISDSEN